MDFDIRKNGLRFGPHTAEELKALLAGGAVDESDAVIKESGEEVSVGVFLGLPPPRKPKVRASALPTKETGAPKPAGLLVWPALVLGLLCFYLSLRQSRFDEYPVASALGETIGAPMIVMLIHALWKNGRTKRGLCISLIIGYGLWILEMKR